MPQICTLCQVSASDVYTCTWDLGKAELISEPWWLISLANSQRFTLLPCLPSEFPRDRSYSSWRGVLHLKGSGWEQPLGYSQVREAALHPSSSQLLGGHQHNAVRHRHRGDLLFTEDQAGKQTVWVSSADSRVQLYLVEFVSYKWHPEVLIKVK